MRYLEVEGSAYEVGFQQGQHFSKKFPSLIKSIKEIDILPYRLQKLIPQKVFEAFFWLEGKKYSKSHKPVHRSNTGLREKCEGLAKGLGLNLSMVYGMVCLEIITSELPHYPTLGCTSLALSSSQTQKKEPILGYNHDFPESFGPHLFVRKNKPKKGYASLSLTYPVLLGAIGGVNCEGLAISINHAFERKIQKRQSATLVTYLLQECLDRCASTDEAIKLILKTRVTNGSMLTVLDHTGKSAVIEVSSRGNFLRKNCDDHSITFNKYQVGELEKYELPLSTRGAKMFKGRLIHAANIERQKRFDQIFSPKKKYSDDSLHEILADHNGGKGGMSSICRHDKTTSTTLASSLIYPTSRKMKVIFGNACEGDYQEFNL